MNNSLPAPLVPPGVDLRDFGYMPLHLERLRRSKAWLIAKRKPELGFFMVNIWGSSWHELPAGSLEDDDDTLASLAMCDPAKWPEIREYVMHGWTRCSDGRLYHRTVAELALTAWIERLTFRKRSAAGHAKRYSSTFNEESFDAAIATAEDYLSRLTPSCLKHAIGTPQACPKHGKGREAKGREAKGEGEATAALTPVEGKEATKRYAFEGEIIRLTPKHFEDWRVAFDTIPDLRAELTTIDAKLADDPGFNRKRWFGTVAAWLRAKHETLLREGKPRQPLNGAGPASDDREADQWRARIKGFAGGKTWRSELWGPEPLSPGCQCPPPILAEFRAQIEARPSA